MRNERFSRRQALLGLAAAAVAPRALAEAPPPAGSARYAVELIVFRQLGALPAPVPTAGVAVTTTVPGRVLPLADTEWQLGPAEAALARGGYTVLAHTAWAVIVPANGRTTAHLEDLLAQPTQVAGSVALQRGQYLFLGIEIDYRPADAGLSPSVVYSIREKRRVKFGERHYFDHPAIGAIASVVVPHGLVENE